MEIVLDKYKIEDVYLKIKVSKLCFMNNELFTQVKSLFVLGRSYFPFKYNIHFLLYWVTMLLTIMSCTSIQLKSMTL